MVKHPETLLSDIGKKALRKSGHPKSMRKTRGAGPRRLRRAESAPAKASAPVELTPVFRQVVSLYSDSRDSRVRAYVRFARAAASGMSRLRTTQVERRSFADWQEWASALPDDSVTRAMVQDEDARPMGEEEYAVKEEMIARLVRHEAELAAAKASSEAQP